MAWIFDVTTFDVTTFDVYLEQSTALQMMYATAQQGCTAPHGKDVRYR